MLRPGGLIVVTVPAFQALWDNHDELNRHYRRYTAGSLRKSCSKTSRSGCSSSATCSAASSRRSISLRS